VVPSVVKARSSPVAVPGPRWIADSGCSDDMHHGGSLGEREFINYRRLDQPLAVHLAKKGAHTQAVGVGLMQLRGRLCSQMLIPLRGFCT
jgi:hypothetical protein